eukprot:TRINITY_DN538_c0_g1_i2.p1 TRINITY_DN538_c0_g1~~TRINITY_DN538_c0_g1_i2.p1  ORF type:complete len:346 (-),score=83.62 TRINITY_DN538_c0_g1_i2:772-1809(-)
MAQLGGIGDSLQELKNAFGPMQNWTIDSVGEWIESQDYIAEYGQNFVDNGVTGECLMDITMKDLRDNLLIEKYSTRKRLISQVKAYIRETSDDIVDYSSDEEDEFDSENRSETDILEDEINSLQRKLQTTKSENDQLRARVARLEQQQAQNDISHQQVVQQQQMGQVSHSIPMNNDIDTDSDSSSDDSVYEYEQTPIYLETIDEEPWREECVRLQEIVETFKTSMVKAGVPVDPDRLQDPNEEKASDDELETEVHDEEKEVEPPTSPTATTDEIDGDVIPREKNYNEKIVQDLDRNDPVKKRQENTAKILSIISTQRSASATSVKSSEEESCGSPRHADLAKTAF